MKDTHVESDYGPDWTYCCLHVNPKTGHIAYMFFTKSATPSSELKRHNGIPSLKSDIEGKGYEYWYVHKDELP